jgi:60 kDa SS-A/Ro ribonucleoprotein
MVSYLKNASTPRKTSQREAIPGSDQVENSAGGFAWKIGSMERLRRWLILGSESGTYYASQQKLTTENVAAVREALDEHGTDAVAEIIAISMQGRAPKPDQAIYALAIACAHKDEKTKQAAIAGITRVCRTGTHLFMFMDFVQDQRGWGRALKRGVAEWYEQDVDKLAYQTVKYRQRGRWSHRDALRLSHPEKGSYNPSYAALYDWICGRDVLPDSEHIRAFREAQGASTPHEAIQIIERYGNTLPREALKTEHLADPGVMEALLAQGMPMTALIRNLANLTRIGVIKPLSRGVVLACDQLGDGERLRKAKVHPLSILTALATYQSGYSLRGSSSWEPVAQIVDALGEAFYDSFNYVEPTGKNHLIAIDLSGSMGSAIGGTSISCRGAAAAMAMTTARTEKNHAVVGFTGEGPGAWISSNGSNFNASYYTNVTGPGLVPLTISPKQRIDDVIKAIDAEKFGPTDCALPMLYALDKGMDVDCFLIYTDSETWQGDIHAAQALEKYRERTGINAKLAVVAMTSAGFSIADPNDSGMLDCVGFDTATPQILADFVGDGFTKKIRRLSPK